MRVSARVIHKTYVSWAFAYSQVDYKLRHTRSKIAHVMRNDEPLDDGSSDTTSSEEKDPEDISARPLFRKKPNRIRDWIRTTEQPPLANISDVRKPLYDWKSYAEFISKSRAYRWLVLELQTGAQVHCSGPNIKRDVGQKILQGSIGNMSNQGPRPEIFLKLRCFWELSKYIESLHVSLSEDMWDHVLCLTGSHNNLQLITVAAYLRLIWPLTGERLKGMLLKLLRCQPKDASPYACPCVYWLSNISRFIH